MSIASLLNLPTNFIHSEVDDLESILYTILAVCTYTNGPAMLCFSIPEEQSIPMNRWFYESSRKELSCRKDNTLSYFSKHIESRLPKYWNDFAPYLKWFIDACWELPTCFLDQPNVATHNKFIKILDDTRQMANRLFLMPTFPPQLIYLLRQSSVIMRMRWQNNEGISWHALETRRKVSTLYSCL